LINLLSLENYFGLLLMTGDQNRFLQTLCLLPVLLGLTLLLCSLAFATSAQQTENDGGRWVFINGQDIIDAPLAIVMNHFRDVQKSDSMIPGLEIKKILKQISESERIDYDHFNVPWPFSDRYMIYHATAKNTAGRGILITMNSLENYPFEENDKVPARIKKSSFLLQSLPDNDSKTRVTIQLAVDPGGYLPIWLIDLASGSWSEDFFRNLRKNIRKELAGQNISKTNWTGRENAHPSTSH
jgi:hypothetical protein